jgi:signal transduction histidine kinase
VARLRAALTLRDRLRAAASHELRTPLNIIVGLADKVLSAANAPGGRRRRSPAGVAAGRCRA